MNLKSKLLIILSFISFISFSQSGKLSGTLYDGEYNDILSFATVVVKGTSTGTTSDFEGDYLLELQEGIYTILYSFVGYETKEISEVEIKAGETTIVDVTLNASSGMLDEVVITTTARRNTEQSVLNLQKNSITVMDGLSIEGMRKTGAGDVASAVKNIPGVSVQGGKFVYVRGLGDRYTKSILNGMDVPGLDPDRNTLQLDIFPTSILENILVIKSSSADLPADFTGGVVDIVTKDFSGREEYSFSIGGTYNSSMHFNSDFLTYEGGKTDFLGFDDGTRDIPIPTGLDIPRPFENDPATTTLTREFNPIMAAARERSLMDFSVGLTAANEYDLGNNGNKLGYIASVSYKNSTDYYDDYQTGGIYRKSNDNSVFELDLGRTQIGELGINNVLMSGLAGLSYKTNKSKLQLNVLHIQNGESKAGVLRQDIRITDAVIIEKDNLEYTERSITNILLAGKHSISDGSWNLDWKLSPTLSKINDKDNRVTAFRVETDGISIDPASGGNPTRIWRELDEVSLAGKLDLTKRHTLFGNDAKLNFGVAYTYKQRDFRIDQYRILVRGLVNFTGDPNQLLAPETIYTQETDRGTYMTNDFNISNSFDSYATIGAAYISEEFKLSDKFKAVLGLRAEKYDLFYTGQDQQAQNVFDEENVFDKLDLFPNVNLIYSLNPETNLRTSYSKTTARPSFKEASVAQIFDPLSNSTFIGNLDIQPTYIDNFDLRFEKFGEGAELFAVSAFYKKFDDPIELSFFRAAPDQFEPRNLGDATVYGAELEFRKNLTFIQGLEEFSVNVNVSVIESQQEYGEEERQTREDNLRDGETLDDSRQLQGQSPYLINAGISYTGIENNIQAGLYYNVQGKTLEIVGAGNIPDVFTLPFHNLTLNISKTFGKEKNSSISFKFENIMNNDVESVFQSFGAEDQIYAKRSPGQPISIGYSYKF